MWPTWLLDHRRAMVQVSSGPRANPLYRDTWTRLDACLALVEQLQDCPALVVEEQDRARDLALAAATVAAQGLVNGWVDEAPVLARVRDLGRTVTGPNLAVERRPDGLRLDVNRPSPTFTQLEQAQVRELPVGRAPGPPPPSLRVGAGSTVRSADDEAAQANTWLALSAWAQTSGLGLDALRLSVDLASLDPGTPEPLALSLGWVISARQQLVPGWTLSAEARSAPGTPSPLLLRGGLAWAPVPAHPEWVLRLNSSQRLPSAAAPAERRVELRVQYNGPWTTPVDPDRWPRGQDAWARTPGWPAHPGWGPNTLLAPLAPADAAQAERLGGGAEARVAEGG